LSAVVSRWAILAFALLSVTCSRKPAGVRTYLAEPFPKHLSEWGLFTGRAVEMKPAAGVVPYDLNTPLFSDFATKQRYIWMPAGTAATYSDTDTFEFPVGAIIAKTFSYPGRVIETRILVHARDGWVGLPYVWNAEGTEANLEIAPDPQKVDFTTASGEKLTIDYVIPNMNQCKGCHENAKRMIPIGPKARHLNREYDYADGKANQLVKWTQAGYLKGAPAEAPRAAVWNDPSSGTLDQRARAYLDINCAHCHNPKGPAGTSGLYLHTTETEAVHLGACKGPVATGPGSGGFKYGIVPGKAEESILIHRMESGTPKVMMPELGRSVIHREGVALIRSWIDAMKGGCDDSRRVEVF